MYFLLSVVSELHSFGLSTRIACCIISYGNKGSFDSSFKVLVLISLCCEPTYATVPRYGWWQGFPLLQEPRMMPYVYLPDEHTLLVYLLILIFFSSLRRRLDLFSWCVCMIFYTFYLFIIIFFFGIVLDYFLLFLFLFRFCCEFWFDWIYKINLL